MRHLPPRDSIGLPHLSPRNVGIRFNFYHSYLVTKYYLIVFFFLQCDGDEYTSQIRALRLEAICFLNIPSYGAGTNPWGTPSSRDVINCVCVCVCVCVCERERERERESESEQAIYLIITVRL